MSKDTTEYDFFVSYAHADDKPPASTPDAAGFVTQFVETLLAEHKRFFKDDRPGVCEVICGAISHITTHINHRS